MSWSKEQLSNNASVLYNYLSADSDKANRVYVDNNGNFQVDKRNSYFFKFRFFRWLFPLGNTSRETTDRLAIQTLRKVSDALEDGTLNPKQVVMQESAPPKGLFMTGQSGTVWVDRETFGMNIGNASRFKAWMPMGNRDENELSYDQKICSRVTVLSQMILHGRDSYVETCGDFGYKQWS